MTWQPSLSSQHCALTMNETDAVLLEYPEDIQEEGFHPHALSSGSGWPPSTAEDSLEGTAQNLTEGIRCMVSFNTRWVR